MISRRFDRNVVYFSLLVLLGSAGVARAQVVQWDNGGADLSWATAGNWVGDQVPGTLESAVFLDIGGSAAPFITTARLDSSRTIASLVYQNNVGQFHMLDLNGFTLSLDDSASVGVFLDTTVFAAIGNGNLELGSPGALGNLSVGWSFLGGTHAAGLLDMSAVGQFTGDLDRLLVGQAENGTAQGSLDLAQTNVIDANSIVVGNSVQTDNGAFTSELTLGASNTITTGEFIVGGTRSRGLVDIPVAGVLTLGAIAERADLIVGRNVVGGSADTSVGIMDLSGSTFDAFLNDLLVGLKIGDGSAAADGTLLGGNAGAIQVGTEVVKGNVSIGQRITSGSGTGVVDFSGQDSFTAELTQMTIGQGGSGTLSLPPTNAIDATIIRVGDNGPATLHLGATNTIEADDVIIGSGASNVTVDMVNGNSLVLGTALRRTNLSIADQDKNTNSNHSATVDLTGATFNAFLDGLVVARRIGGGAGDTTGSIIGAVGGTVSIGESGNTSMMTVAVSENSDRAIGTVDFSGLDNFSANLDKLQIGIRNGGVVASGTVMLGASNVIDANAIIFADNGSATVHLGQTNEIVADTIVIAAREGNATIDIPFGGSLTLGSASKRTVLSIADQDKNTNSNHSATVDLTGATFNAFLDGLVVARRIGGGAGDTTGTIFGAVGGTVSIGESGNTSMMTVAVSENSDRATGTVDFSGLDTFSANLDKLQIGIRNSGFVASGTVMLGASNVIDANAIIFADNGSATVHLGQTNEIVADTIVIAAREGNATIDIPFGGSLTLGSASKRTVLSIADQDKNTNSNHSATVDLTGATFNAFLDGLVVARRIGGGAGDTTGSIFGAVGGTVSIGESGNTSMMTVAVSENSDRATGTVDFSGLDTFSANLDKLQIGIRNSGFVASGTVMLGASNVIDANEFIIGQGGTGVLDLGASAVVDVNSISLGDGGNGTLTFNGGELTAQTVVKGSGTAAFNWNGGTLHVDQFGTSMTPLDLFNTGSGELAPGGSVGSTVIFGDYVQGMFASLEIEIASLASFDVVDIDQAAFLDGTLTVDFLNGFTPLVGESYEILTFASRSGEFSQLVGLGVVGDAFVTAVYSDTSVTLEMSLASDINLDGIVDIGDFTLWADAFGNTGAGLPEDLSGDGRVDIGDFTLWADHFGSTSGPSGNGPSANAVPEPSSVALLALGLLALGAYSWRRRAG